VPLFPFGYGLSYTSFSYSNLRLSKEDIRPDEELRVMVDVTNTGRTFGKEIVQLYVRDVKSSLIRPEKELKGFAKVSLEPGKTKTVTMTLNRRSLAYYDDLAQKWVAEAGEFEILVGSSSADIRATTHFRLTETARFGDRPELPVMRLSTKSTISQLLANEEAKAIFAKYFPSFESAPQLGMGMGFTLEQIAGFAPQVFTDEVMQAIAADLEKISPVPVTEMTKPPQISLWQRIIVKLVSALRPRPKSR
jgi:beta-glucosidase